MNCNRYYNEIKGAAVSIYTERVDSLIPNMLTLFLRWLTLFLKQLTKLSLRVAVLQSI